MPRPSNVQKQYAFDFNYIVSYYIDNIDFYEYRSNEHLNRWNKPYLSVFFEENGMKLPVLQGRASSAGMSDSFLLFLKKRQIFMYIKNLIPVIPDYSLKCSIDMWCKTL